MSTNALNVGDAVEYEPTGETATIERVIHTPCTAPGMVGYLLTSYDLITQSGRQITCWDSKVNRL